MRLRRPEWASDIRLTMPLQCCFWEAYTVLSTQVQNLNDIPSVDEFVNNVQCAVYRQSYGHAIET